MRTYNVKLTARSGLVFTGEEKAMNRKDAYIQAIEKAFDADHIVKVEVTEAPEVEPMVGYDEVLYNESYSGISMFSGSPVMIVGEQKMNLEDGSTVEQYIYMLPEDKIGTYISIKANIIITE